MTATTTPESRNFNPLPPHGGRPLTSVYIIAHLYFNPLPPHGGRPHTYFSSRSVGTFQSTPSAWRETKKGGTVIGWIDISIHSLRMEGDKS